jgi:mono/diheme cytochrome c family protein
MTDTAPAARRNAARALAPLAAAATLAVALAAPAVLSQDGDATRGQLLYDNHCQACHTSQAHVRANRKARTIADIRGFARRWQAVLGLGWSESDVNDVATWLFLRFYDPDRPKARKGTGTPT